MIHPPCSAITIIDYEDIGINVISIGDIALHRSKVREKSDYK